MILITLEIGCRNIWEFLYNFKIFVECLLFSSGVDIRGIRGAVYRLAPYVKEEFNIHHCFLFDITHQWSTNYLNHNNSVAWMKPKLLHISIKYTQKMIMGIFYYSCLIKKISHLVKTSMFGLTSFSKVVIKRNNLRQT